MDNSTDPLDIIPDAAEIKRRLGATYRAARILRGLLKLSERRQAHDRLSDSSETQQHQESASC